MTDRPRHHWFHSRTWRITRFLGGVGLGSLALYLLNGQRNELVGASAELANLRVGWLLCAIVVEVGSYVSFAALQRRLLRVGRVTSPLPSTTVMSLAAGAIANSIPAGPAFASFFAFRFYRRKGADEAVAGWTLLTTLVCAAVALGLLATVGVLLAISEGAAYDLTAVTFGVLVLSVVADAVVWQRRWLARVIVWLLLVSRRIFGRPHRHGLEIVEDYAKRLEAVRMTWRDIVATIGFGFANWALDCSCLLFSFLAVGAPIPLRGLLLAYGAGQLAANLPVTPGGLGLVEGSLTIAIVAFGGAELSTVAAVLCYRIVSFWGELPIGWACWGAMTVLHRREDLHTAGGRDLVGSDASYRAVVSAMHGNPTQAPEVGS